MIIFHLITKAKFFILCVLVRLQGTFEVITLRSDLGLIIRRADSSSRPEMN